MGELIASRTVGEHDGDPADAVRLSHRAEVFARLGIELFSTFGAALPGHVISPGVVDDGGVAAVDLAVDEALDDAVVASSCRLSVA